MHTVDKDGLGGEFYSNGGGTVGEIQTANVAGKNVGFSDSRIANKDNCIDKIHLLY
jgi:hypothetical protein